MSGARRRKKKEELKRPAAGAREGSSGDARCAFLDRFCLHGNNGPRIHRLLARLIDYVETSSGCDPRYQEYMRRGDRNGYEIEHIRADHFKRYSDEFEHPADFTEYRNRSGCLLLLPKSFNASYGDLPYGEKHNHYLKQNLLAQGLHEDACERDPGFKQFIRTSALRFGPHYQFHKDDLEKRQRLYTKLAERVWNPERLAHEAESRVWSAGIVFEAAKAGEGGYDAPGRRHGCRAADNPPDRR